MAQPRSHMDMFHAAPPPPAHHPHGQPPPHDAWKHAHPSYAPAAGPASEPHPPPYHNTYQPRQYPPSTPQTPQFATTPHPPQPLTPQTPHYPHGHGHPSTPQHHPSTPRAYYPSPPQHLHPQPHAGPSRPPQNRYDHAGPSHPPQYVYRQPNQPHPPYPHSAPPRIMQHWPPTHPSPTRTSPSAHRLSNPNMYGGYSDMLDHKDLVHEYLDLGDSHPSGQHQLASPAYIKPTLTVHDWGPDSGRQGDEVAFTTEIDYALDTAEDRARGLQGRAFRIMFGKMPVGTRVSVQPAKPARSITGTVLNLFIKVPPLHLTGNAVRSDRLPVSVQCLRGTDVVDETPVGEFTYVNANAHVRIHSVPATSTEHPYHPMAAGGAGAGAGGLKRPGERLEQDSLRPWGQEAHRRVVSGDARLEHQSVSDYPGMGGHVPRSNGQVHHPDMQAQAPQHQDYAGGMPAWSEGTPALTQSGQMASVMEPCSTVMQPVPAPGSQPSLIRASQVPAVRGNTWLERLKAEIVFQNDLLSMTKAWTPEEWQAKRRLVKVWRRQQDSQIYMAFRPVKPDELPNEEGCVIVSCIFRDDKNACFITSVDIIFLLEAVIGQRFSIEEKNRIRRNLEGFRPQTVSKSKPGSEDFFRTVMAFGDPKPRNIEKDLKVFPWDVLPAAVKKIIGKYTAHYHPSAEPLQAQGASPAMMAINQLPAEFAPLPQAAHGNYPHQPNGMAHDGWQQSLAQGHHPHHSQAHNGDLSHYDPSLVHGHAHGQAQGQGVGLGVPMPDSSHLRRSSGVAPAPQGQPPLHVDTSHQSYSNNSTYYSAGPYSPTPQMTHSSSSNLVQSELIASPEDINNVPTAGPTPVDPPSYHAPIQPYSADQYWTGNGNGNGHANGNDGITAYSMGGAATFDDSGMYTNMLVKPLPLDDPVVTNDLDVRNIYTANSA